jgi:hypothetical protein
VAWAQAGALIAHTIFGLHRAHVIAAAAASALFPGFVLSFRALADTHHPARFKFVKLDGVRAVTCQYT